MTPLYLAAAEQPRMWWDVAGERRRQDGGGEGENVRIPTRAAPALPTKAPTPERIVPFADFEPIAETLGGVKSRSTASRSLHCAVPDAIPFSAVLSP